MTGDKSIRLDPPPPGRRITLGELVRDWITGFKGVAMERTEYWQDRSNVIRVEARELGSDGYPVSAEFHENRLRTVDGPEPEPEP